MDLILKKREEEAKENAAESSQAVAKSDSKPTSSFQAFMKDEGDSENQISIGSEKP